jgi:hypothetical protein
VWSRHQSDSSRAADGRANPSRSSIWPKVKMTKLVSVFETFDSEAEAIASYPTTARG